MSTPPPISDLAPVPFGVNADTSDYLPGVSEAALDRLQPDRGAIITRGREGAAHLGLTAERNADDLAQSGWGILMPATMEGQDAALILKALEPLLNLRKSQAGALYKEFTNERGYVPNLSARDWLESLGSGLASVDPAQGVPYYLMLVGNPQDIPFSFQFDLDTFFAVGRLYFENVEEYEIYARNMVAQESASAPSHDKSIALFAPKNPADRATALFHDNVALNLSGKDGGIPVGQSLGFTVHSTLANDATKGNLLKVLHGESEAKNPAMLITGSHGVAFNPLDPNIAEKQGAILTQDWGGKPSSISPATYLAASEIENATKTPGMIHFFFACYSVACPAQDTYSYDEKLVPLAVAPKEFISRLPQKVLLNGAQAVIGHIDRVWANSFQNSKRMPMVQKLRDPIARILQGRRVGDAMDGVNQQWSNLAAVLGELINRRSAVKQLVSSQALANAFLERDDARNYMVLGDPAARLRLG